MTFVQSPPYGRINNTLNGTHPAIPLLCAFQTRLVFVWGALYCGTGRPSREAERGLRCRGEAAGGALAGQPVCSHWELSHDASVLSKESAETVWAEWPSRTTCQEEIKKTMTSLTKRRLTLIKCTFWLTSQFLSTVNLMINLGDWRSDLKLEFLPEVSADSWCHTQEFTDEWQRETLHRALRFLLRRGGGSLGFICMLLFLPEVSKPQHMEQIYHGTEQLLV